MPLPITDVIIRPLLTERSTILKEKFNQYLFEAAKTASKTDIKRAIEELFKVQVLKVRTMTMPGKFRRQGKSGGYRSDWKKALVTLQQGQKIDIADQTA